MDLDFCPRRRDELTERSVGDELIVLDQGLGAIHRFNPTASRIWSWCDGRQSVGRIAQRIAQTFGEDPRRIEIHVTATVRQLASAGLLKTAPGTTDNDTKGSLK